MSEIFGSKSGTLRGAVDLLEPLLEVRFRRVAVPGTTLVWMVALSKDRREHLVILPNESLSGGTIDSSSDGYDVLLYLVRSWREERLTRAITSETRFRYVRPAARVQQFADDVLAKL